MYDQWILNTGVCPTFTSDDLSRYVILYWVDGLSPTVENAYELQYYDWNLQKEDYLRVIYSYMIIGDQNGA